MTKEKFLQKVNKESVVTMDGSDLSDDIVRLVNTVASVGYDAGRASAFEWIPTSERLPDKNGWYLTSSENRVARTSFDKLGGFCSYAKILAWSHIPSPYKPEEKQDGK